MPILYRYIIKELLIPFLLSLLILTFVLMLTKVLNIAELLFEKGLHFETLKDVLFSIALYLMGFTLPMAFLVSILICFGRLSQDSEIIALRASGVSYFKICLPVFLLAGLLSLGSYFLHVNALPKANWKTAKTINKLAQTDPENFLQEKVWLTGFGQTWIYIHKLGGDRKFVKIAIHQKKEGYLIPRVITAKSGFYDYKDGDTEISFHLINGTIEEPSELNGTNFNVVSFGKYIVKAPITKKGFEEPSKKIYHLTAGELDTRIRDTPEKQIDYPALLHEKYSRSCMSFACLIFFLMGFPISIHFQRSEKSANFAFGACLALVWYLLLLTGKGMALGGTLPISVATWLPNIIMGSLGLFLMQRFLRT